MTHDYLKHSGDVAPFPNGSQHAYYWSSLIDETKIRASCGWVAARCLLEHVLSNASLVREVNIRPFLSTLMRLEQLKVETASLPDFDAYTFDRTSWLSPVYPLTSQSCALPRTYNQTTLVTTPLLQPRQLGSTNKPDFQNTFTFAAGIHGHTRHHATICRPRLPALEHPFQPKPTTYLVSQSLSRCTQNSLSASKKLSITFN